MFINLFILSSAGFVYTWDRAMYSILAYASSSIFLREVPYNDPLSTDISISYFPLSMSKPLSPDD